jgi:hypothetical protein
MVTTNPTQLNWGRRLVQKVTCPTCWHTFAPEQVLFVARHLDLKNDEILGADEQQRFLPDRFTVKGEALDARGAATSQMACPRCHLHLADSLLEVPPLFISIIGAPASGKSYFLATMTWQLRALLPRAHLSFSDADPVANSAVTEYEQTLFLNADPTQVTAIRKTELDDRQLHKTALIDGVSVRLPAPLQFAVWPMRGHPNVTAPHRVGRVIVCYDNAGEVCLPGMGGQEEINTMVVRHLAESGVLMVLFDPAQDPRLRQRCSSDDPQLVHGLRPGGGKQTSHLIRQEMILKEAAVRMRRYLGMSERQRTTKPLIIIVSKFDLLTEAAGISIDDEPYQGLDGHAPFKMDMARVERTSQVIEGLFRELCPEFAATAESISEIVHYVPVSSFGCKSVYVEQGGKSFCGIRPADIRPKWVTVPIMYCMTKYSKVLLDQSSGMKTR